MMFLRAVFLFLIFGTAFTLPAYYFWYKPKFKRVEHSFSPTIKETSEPFARIKTKALFLKKYTSARDYNPRICFLIDMKIPSGKKRFFVYDLKKDSILLSGLVAHGSCNNGFKMDANFSNKVNSGCSSFGKFKVGKSYNGRFGIAYKLYGLDESNNNAFERTLVLHSYKCVPDQETHPLPICNSRGCPMVSVDFLQRLRSYLDHSDKPVLLNIY